MKTLAESREVIRNGKEGEVWCPSLHPSMSYKVFLQKSPITLPLEKVAADAALGQGSSTPGLEPVFSRWVYSLLRSGPLGTTGEL